MMREELMRDVLGDNFDEYRNGEERVENLKVAKTKFEARMKEIQNLFGEIAGDRGKEKEFNENYGHEYSWLNEEIQMLDEELNN